MSRCACGRSGRVLVRVDLSHFYSDERARLMLSVAGSRSVRSVARRLRAVCALPPAPLLLLAAGHVLPGAERLAALPPDTQLTLLPAPLHVQAETPALLACGAPAPHLALEETKRRALLELDRLCERPAPTFPDGDLPSAGREAAPDEAARPERCSPGDSTLEVEPARARRRRVRRRRAAPYHEEDRGVRPPRLVTALGEGGDHPPLNSS